MTKNPRAKANAHALASATGQSYEAARRQQRQSIGTPSWTWPVEPLTRYLPRAAFYGVPERGARLERTPCDPPIDFDPGSWGDVCPQLAGRISAAGRRHAWRIVDPYPIEECRARKCYHPTEQLNHYWGWLQNGAIPGWAYFDLLDHFDVTVPLSIELPVRQGDAFMRYLERPWPERTARNCPTPLIEGKEESLRVAHRSYSRGVALGQTALGAAFAGRLPAEDPINRTFLRSLHGLVLTSYRIGARAKASRLAEAALWLEPSDPFGHRFILTALTRGLPWRAMEALTIGAASIDIVPDDADVPAKLSHPLDSALPAEIRFALLP